MANLKASKQGIKVNNRNQMRNKHLKTLLKKAIKSARLSIQSASESSVKIVTECCRVIDRMVSKGVIKKNTAARNKSRLMKSLHSAQVK